MMDEIETKGLILKSSQGRAKLTLSVAMCTYNGELYLREQLTSIAKQTRLPDELVV